MAHFIMAIPRLQNVKCSDCLWQIEEHTRQLAQQTLISSLSRSGSISSNSSSSCSVTPTKRSHIDHMGRSRGRAKRVMLSWAQKAVTKYAGFVVLLYQILSGVIQMFEYVAFIFLPPVRQYWQTGLELSVALYCLCMYWAECYEPIIGYNCF